MPRKPRRAAIQTAALPIRARYDAARDGVTMARHWALADTLDADSANSPSVRQKLRKRSRLESDNSGYSKGIELTQANYVVGRGPKLRMQTGSPGFNAMIEAQWLQWTKAIKFARKLRTTVKAKLKDGEGFLIIRDNDAIPGLVKLGLMGAEAEKCATPNMPYAAVGRIDGIHFDGDGNPTFYDFLKYHPGGQWAHLSQQVETIPAKFVFHLFREDRAEQHRGVPELTSTLNLGAQGRRYREATLSAAENIANFSILLKTQGMPEPTENEPEPSFVTPMSAEPIEKGMMVGLPAGYDAYQPKSEQPSATYDTFVRSQVCETARPVNMPYNIAACDSSGYSFSGGKLDHLTYFVSVDVEQQDIEDLVLDPLFAVWFREATLRNGWITRDTLPAHTWDWPARPQIDEGKTANARKTNLQTGATSLRRVYAEDSYDFEEELEAMAEDYGVTVDEMRTILLKQNLQKGVGAGAEDTEDDEEARPAPPQAGGNPRRG